MDRKDLEARLRVLAEHAWEGEVRWPYIKEWVANFTGASLSKEEEETNCLYLLTRFMYFSKRMVREMLRSLYRDHIYAPVMQRIRRNYNGSRDVDLLARLYASELRSTRFIGLGNPSESGAHLLYYFRQVNYLKKDLFADLFQAFAVAPVSHHSFVRMSYQSRDASVRRYVFFDDLVGSGTQVTQYLSSRLSKIRKDNPGVELKFISLFASTQGLDILNERHLFDGNASCLFELDAEYKAFSPGSRYFLNSPDWFDPAKLQQMVKHYGAILWPSDPLGYKDGQLLLGFHHNTPDNTLPIFWDEGLVRPWRPVFTRFTKVY